MWVNTEQTWRMKMSSLLCSSLGPAAPAGAQPWLASVLWRSARLWLQTALRCHQPNPPSAFLYLIFPAVRPCFSPGVWLADLPSRAAHQPLTFLLLFLSIWPPPWLSLGLVLHLIVSLNTDNIDIVKLSGLETSEDSKALRSITGACPEGICLLAAQARAHQRTSFSSLVAELCTVCLKSGPDRHGST